MDTSGRLPPGVEVDSGFMVLLKCADEIAERRDGFEQNYFQGTGR